MVGNGSGVSVGSTVVAVAVDFITGRAVKVGTLLGMGEGSAVLTDCVGGSLVTITTVGVTAESWQLDNRLSSMITEQYFKRNFILIFSSFFLEKTIPDRQGSDGEQDAHYC